MKKKIIGSVLAGAVAVGAAFATGTGALAAEANASAPSAYTSAQLIEGVVFLQGDLGQSLIDNGALGDISSAEKTKVEELLADDNAKQLAAESTQQLLDERPELATDLDTALDGGDPVAVSSALRNVVEDAVDTPAAKAATAAVQESEQTYVPGEVGPDCLFNVAVGGYLVIAVAAVGVGVVALASVALVGDVYVAGENAASKRAAAASDTDGQFVAALLQSV
jgi:hypothetical protein